MDYFEALKTWLENGSYTAADAAERVDMMVAHGRITAAQETELTALAETRAIGDADVQVYAKSIEDRVADCETALVELAGLIAGLTEGN